MTTATFFVGAALIVAGTTMAYVPAGLIVAGAFITALSLLMARTADASKDEK